MDAFPPSVTDAIGAKFAESAGVDAEKVTVVVASASVLLTIAIEAASADEAAAVVTTVSAQVSDAASAQAFLEAAVPGIQVQEVTSPPQAPVVDGELIAVEGEEEKKGASMLMIIVAAWPQPSPWP